MALDAITVLITGTSPSEKGTDCEGVLVSSVRSIGTCFEDWQATIFTSRRLRVGCQLTSYECIGSGFDKHGDPATLYDGEPYHYPGKQAELELAAANFTYITIGTPDLACDLPVFISSDPDLVPSAQKIMVKLEVDVLSDLPDVQAYVAYGNMMNRRFEGTGLDGMCDMTEFQILAQKSQMISGQFLPVVTDKKHGSIPGVLHLGPRKAGNVFEATLNLVNSGATIHAGTILYRTVKWEEDGVKCERSALIGTIV